MNVKAVDIWAVGCVFVNLMIDDFMDCYPKEVCLDEVDYIFSLFGTPT